MAHYAYIDENNKVIAVVVGIDENEIIDGLDAETFYAKNTPYNVKRTSYNANIRFNYAGIGFTYDPDADAFIAPQPECGHSELMLDTNVYQWKCENAEHDINLS